MALNKTTELINSCDATFKRSGLLRLAEAALVSSGTESNYSANRGYEPPLGGTSNVLGQVQSKVTLQRDGTSQLGVSQGNAAVDLRPQSEVQDVEVGAIDAVRNGWVRPLGISSVDAILPNGGLPTGKVIELSLSGGAACGTQMALWACRAAQQQAQLTGTNSWCAFIDPTASLHAPGVLSSGVSLPRLLVLRPALEDVERVALRLSEANVFSVVIIDLVGVPWLSARTAARATSVPSRTNPKLELNTKRQNWTRTVRQLALRLEHTQAQVIVLTNAETRQSLPLPVALRLHMRADPRGVTLQVVKESQGRVGAQGTVPWSEWGQELAGAQVQSPAALQFQRAKALPLPRYGEADYTPSKPTESLVRTPDRNGRETGIPIVASSRLARTSRASL